MVTNEGLVEPPVRLRPRRKRKTGHDRPSQGLWIRQLDLLLASGVDRDFLVLAGQFGWNRFIGPPEVGRNRIVDQSADLRRLSDAVIALE
jgi:hypothetical protein